MSAPLLTICIPTFGNSEILSQNITQLSSNIEGFEDKVEIVITENFSSALESQKLSELRSNTVKVFSNSQNLGFSKNLLIGLSLAKGKYLMLLGDDDFVDAVLMRDLILYLSSKSVKNLVFLPLHDLRYSTRVVTPAFAFMRSGAMPGVIYNVNAINLAQLQTDIAIYPQVELAMDVFYQFGAEYLVSDGCIRVGPGLPLLYRFSDKMSRPIDYGVVERFTILKKIQRRYSMLFKDYFYCYVNLLSWANQIFFKVYRSKPILAIKFAWANFYKNPDKAFFILLQFYLLMKALLGNLKS